MNEGKAPTYSVDMAYWYDQKKDQWNARITYGETRQGKQYGGKVVDEYACPKGASHERFMHLVRQRVTLQMKTFWT